jgi:hypothetical protein
LSHNAAFVLYVHPFSINSSRRFEIVVKKLSVGGLEASADLAGCVGLKGFVCGIDLSDWIAHVDSVGFSGFVDLVGSVGSIRLAGFGDLDDLAAKIVLSLNV